MAEKVSFKIVIVIFSLCGILSSCRHPIDIESFLASPEVQAIIETTKGSVKVDPKSDDFAKLKAGNSKISGLTPDKYYKLEEYDETLVFKRNLFVRSNGSNSEDFSLISSLAGDQVVDLKNNYTYKVTYARSFPNNKHKYFAFGDTKAEDANLTGGAVTISDNKDYFLNVAPVIDATKKYQVMKIPIPGLSGTNTPWGNFRTSANYTGTSNVYGITETIYQNQYNKHDTSKDIGIYQYRTQVFADPTHFNLDLQNMSIIAVANVNTQSDYVFTEYDTSDKITNFVVLRVNRPDEKKITIDVTVTYTSKDSPAVTVTPSGGSFPQNSNLDISISVNSAGSYTEIKWYKDNSTTPTAGTSFTFSINDDNSAYNKQAGKHQITLVGYKNGIPYSTIVEITIRETP